METSYIRELNDSLRNGRPPPKSKKSDFVPRICVALHVLECIFKSLDEVSDFIMAEEISVERLESAIFLI